MGSSLLTSQIGQRISLPGHFDVPVVLEDARPLLPAATDAAQAGGSDDSAGYECRVRLPDGSLEEAVIAANNSVKKVLRAARSYKTPTDALEQAALYGGGVC